MAIIILEENKYRKALLVGCLSLVIVSPIVIYSFLFFAPTLADNLSQAQSILVDYRIPHHANIDIWFGTSTVIKVAIIILSLLILRGRRIWLILFIPFFVSLTLTIIQMLTKSHFMALIFPWRISTFLVPLSFFILASRAIYYIFCRYGHIINTHRKAINLLFTIILILLLIFGLTIQLLRNKDHNERVDSSLVAFVAKTKVKGDVYLIPPNMERFRLQTGSPILVDRKTHPYKDVEVLHWYERIQLANRFYSDRAGRQCDALNEVASKYGVTHVVLNKKHILNCDFSKIIFNDGVFSVYSILSSK
jgi:hypothetical protein